MAALGFAARALAAAGTPAGDMLRETGPVHALLPGFPAGAEGVLRRGGGGSPARLAASAFRTTRAADADKLDGILHGGGVLVSTGQQPDLFGGPLYVLYKALGACVVAAAIEETHGVPALPMFWVASDDHDWDEVGRVDVLDADGQSRQVTLEPPPGRSDRSVGVTRVPDGITDRIDELCQYIPISDFSKDYLDLLRGAYVPSRTLGEAFTELLSGLLADRGLVFLDSGAKAVRSAAAPLYARVVQERTRVAEALAEGEAAVEAAGYEAQLHRRAGGIPLFLDTSAGRMRLLADGEGIREGPRGSLRSEAEVLATLESDPDRFSPNVALRPVLESWLLPVAATILGPSELAYWAELPPLFEWAETPLPVARPRPSWNVVESKVRKVLDKLDVEPEAFADGGRALADRVAEEGLPAPVRAALDEARQDVGAAFGALEEAVEAELPGVRASVGAARHSAFSALEELQRAVLGRVRERQSVLVEQIHKAARHLYPDGKPQERVVSPFYFLVRYGSAFLSAVGEAADEWAREGPGGVAGPGEAR
jgi:bacillithiol biosynthesis cysteine-adding enzyme BshC